MKLALAIAFFATAALYASVGFGGGSTYTALLAVGGTPYVLIPVISLACNIAVVSGNSVQFARARLVRWQRLAPLVAFSIPAAWIGGRMAVSETLFLSLLWTTLLVAGARLLLARPPADEETRPVALWINAVIGSGIGLLSGIVGIGGGIFLAPLLHGLRWGRAREIAAACSVFILLNSISGLAGQLGKFNAADWPALHPYWLLLPAVVMGGFIGNRLGLRVLRPTTLRRLTGALIVIVALRLAWRWFGLI